MATSGDLTVFCPVCAKRGPLNMLRFHIALQHESNRQQSRVVEIVEGVAECAASPQVATHCPILDAPTTRCVEWRATDYCQSSDESTNGLIHGPSLLEQALVDRPPEAPQQPRPLGGDARVSNCPICRNYFENMFELRIHCTMEHLECVSAARGAVGETAERLLYDHYVFTPRRANVCRLPTHDRCVCVSFVTRTHHVLRHCRTRSLGAFVGALNACFPACVAPGRPRDDCRALLTAELGDLQCWNALCRPLRTSAVLPHLAGKLAFECVLCLQVVFVDKTLQIERHVQEHICGEYVGQFGCTQVTPPTNYMPTPQACRPPVGQAGVGNIAEPNCQRAASSHDELQCTVTPIFEVEEDERPSEEANPCVGARRTIESASNSSAASIGTDHGGEGNAPVKMEIQDVDLSMVDALSDVTDIDTADPSSPPAVVDAVVQPEEVATLQTQTTADLISAHYSHGRRLSAIITFCTRTIHYEPVEATITLDTAQSHTAASDEMDSHDLVAVSPSHSAELAFPEYLATEDDTQHSLAEPSPVLQSSTVHLDDHCYQMPSCPTVTGNFLVQKGIDTRSATFASLPEVDRTSATTTIKWCSRARSKHCKVETAGEQLPTMSTCVVRQGDWSVKPVALVNSLAWLRSSARQLEQRRAAEELEQQLMLATATTKIGRKRLLNGLNQRHLEQPFISRWFLRVAEPNDHS